MKKIISYIFILALTLGLLSPVVNVHAQATPTPVTASTLGTCYVSTFETTGSPPKQKFDDSGKAVTQKYSNLVTKADCDVFNKGAVPGDPYWVADTNGRTGDSVTPGGSTITNTNTTASDTAIDKAVQAVECGVTSGDKIIGCAVFVSYYVFFVFPSFLLTVIAKLFNALIAISLSSTLFKVSDFLPAAWATVRDIANIFFIFILLYAAFEMITGLGHHPQKVIGQVLIMALLINFSMFFSKVIIDSSNILALVFYNKVAVKTTGNAYTPSVDATKSDVPDKDMAGAIASGFNPARTMDPTLFNKTVTVNGKEQAVDAKSPAILLGVIIVSGIILLFACYAFFVASFAFLGRLIELFLLIIFSPFAFMSYAVPSLAKQQYIGWNSWLTKILSTSFMAPVFMFFIYLIAKITENDFAGKMFSPNQEFLGSLLLIIIPAMISIGLLMKATDFAKKGSGQFGETAVGLGKAAFALAVGGGALTLASAGRNTVGAVAKDVQKEKSARQKTYTFQDTQEKWKNKQYVRAAVSSVTNIPKALSAVTAEGLHKFDINGKSVGQRMQDADKGVEHKEHAEHTIHDKIEELSKGMGVDKHTAYKDLSDTNQKKVKESIDKDIISKAVYKKAFGKLTSTEEIESIEEAHKKRTVHKDPIHGDTFDYEVERYIRDPNDSSKRIKDTFKSKEVGKGGDYEVKHSEAPQAMGEFVQALRKGTYDLRNLPDIKTKGMSTALKIPTAFASTAASSFKAAMKTATGVENYGKPQKDFFDDLKNTIGESLKNAKIKVDLGGHDAAAHDDHKE